MKVVDRIEAETGLQSIEQIVDKAERHSETMQTLNEMSKTLQTKILQLIQKKDMLTK